MAQDHTHDGMDEGQDHEHDEIQQCIEECLNCHAACTMTAQYALGEGGDKADPGLVGVLLDCAEICQAAVRAMVRGGEMAAAICRACAELCEACAAECEKHDHEHCKLCAQMCRECAADCRHAALAVMNHTRIRPAPGVQLRWEF